MVGICLCNIDYNLGLDYQAVIHQCSEKGKEDGP